MWQSLHVRNDSMVAGPKLEHLNDCITDGKAKATVTPDGAPPAFFLRARVK